MCCSSVRQGRLPSRRLVAQALCMAFRRLATYLHLLPGDALAGPCAGSLRCATCCSELHSALWPPAYRKGYTSGQATLHCPLPGARHNNEVCIILLGRCLHIFLLVGTALLLLVFCKHQLALPHSTLCGGTAGLADRPDCCSPGPAAAGAAAAGSEPPHSGMGGRNSCAGCGGQRARCGAGTRCCGRGASSACGSAG